MPRAPAETSAVHFLERRTSSLPVLLHHDLILSIISKSSTKALAPCLKRSLLVCSLSVCSAQLSEDSAKPQSRRVDGSLCNLLGSSTELHGVMTNIARPVFDDTANLLQGPHDVLLCLPPAQSTHCQSTSLHLPYTVCKSNQSRSKKELPCMLSHGPGRQAK